MLHRIDIRKAAVHVPLYIRNISLVKHRADLVKNIVPHILSGKVKH